MPSETLAAGDLVFEDNGTCIMVYTTKDDGYYDFLESYSYGEFLDLTATLKNTFDYLRSKLNAF